MESFTFLFCFFSPRLRTTQLTLFGNKQIGHLVKLFWRTVLTKLSMFGHLLWFILHIIMLDKSYVQQLLRPYLLPTIYSERGENGFKQVLSYSQIYLIKTVHAMSWYLFILLPDNKPYLIYTCSQWPRPMPTFSAALATLAMKKWGDNKLRSLVHTARGSLSH